MSVAKFTEGGINDEFRFYGHVGSGHPDPDIMFADGKFYLITQTGSDFVSDGPWTGELSVRVGIDTNGDGAVNQWSEWHNTSETYDYIKGYAKQVERIPAKVNFAQLPKAKGVQIELKGQQKALPAISQIELIKGQSAE